MVSFHCLKSASHFPKYGILNHDPYVTMLMIFIRKGVGEGGAEGARAPPPLSKVWGGSQVGLCPPPHFWAEQVF